MKRYLIACISNDVTDENLQTSDIKFINPKIYSYNDNQMLEGLVSRYRTDLRIDYSIPTIAIALADFTDANTAVIITNSLGKEFTYGILEPYKAYFDAGASVCIDVLIDASVHFEFEKLVPDWLKVSKKRVDAFISRA